MRKYDVIVCGGGPSGFVAAIAAARSGAKVAIIEQLNHFGGLATGGMVSPVSEFNSNGRRVIDGIPWEVMLHLQERGGADLSYPIGNVPFDPEIYKIVIQEMLISSGVEIYLESTLIDCVVFADKIQNIRCLSNGSVFSLSAKVFVDSTGTACLSMFAGIPFQKEPQDDECQAASLCFRLAGVDTDKLENIHLKDPHTRYFNSRVRAVLEECSAPNFGGPWFIWGLHDGIVSVNMTRGKVDSCSPLNNSRMVCRLREDMFTFVSLLQNNVREFANSYLMDSAVLTGYRENRRIAGAHILTGDEIVSGYEFADAIACTAHPIDVHIATSKEQAVTFLDGVGYIPYRSLYSGKIDNLLVSGRCISADRNAFASIRVQAPCMAVGEAAGYAAALSSKEDVPVSEIDVKELQDMLTP